MKTLKALLVAIISFLCVRTANAQQQCSAPWAGDQFQDNTPNQQCPAGGPNAIPYTIVGLSIIGTATFKCTSTANAVYPPGPNVVYWSWYEAQHVGDPQHGPQTGYGERYCNLNNAPWTSFDCYPYVSADDSTATSPSDYNRFYNRAYSYYADPQTGQCPQNNYTQDFEQCPGLACQPPPPRCCKCPVPPTAKGKEIYDKFVLRKVQTDGCQEGFSTGCCGSTPIIIDTSGNGFLLTNAANGVKFDISGRGVPVQISWTAPASGNAFLCLPDANGACDDGKDLFGSITPQPASSTPNGFAALGVYDQPAKGGNGDGIIDSRDAIFSSLRLWIDANHDGISQPNEIYPLPALGVYSISLSYKEDRRTDQYGNVFRYRAEINPGGPPGSVSRMAYDVFLVLAEQANSITAQSCPVAPQSLPEKDGRLK